MITDYYGDGNRYRGVTSTGGNTRTIVIAGNAVLHDTANDREDADHKRKEPKIMDTTKQAVEAEQAERATPMRKLFKFDATKRDFADGSSNGQRAEVAAAAVEAASRARHEAVTIDEDGIRDLLADLGHLCDREGLDFPGIINTAKKDWRAER